MGTAAHEGVEFLDLAPDLPAGGDDALDPGEGPRPRWRAVLLVALVVGGLLVVARVVGAPPPPPPAAVAPAPVFGGRVALPTGFGTPVRFATATATEADVVWALGDSGQLVRIEGGRVTAGTAARGYHALAVRPDGRTVYVSTGRFAPTVVALDPDSLEPRGGFVLAAAPVTALAAGVGTVWAGSTASVQGWTSDLARPLRTMALPSEVSAVRSLQIVGAGLQALVTTRSPGTSALLRLQPPGGAPVLSSTFTGAVSLVPGLPALVAHRAPDDTVEVAVDPAPPGAGALGRPLTTDATIWPAGQVGTARWLASSTVSSSLDCFDAVGQLVGRMSVGDAGSGVVGPVVTTSRAVYAATADGELARGGHASCGVAPRASTGGRRGN